MNDDPTGDRLYSMDAVAQLLGVSVETIRLHARRQSLKTTKIGRRVLVPKDELSRVMKYGLPSLVPKVEK